MTADQQRNKMEDNEKKEAIIIQSIQPKVREVGMIAAMTNVKGMSVAEVEQLAQKLEIAQAEGEAAIEIIVNALFDSAVSRLARQKEENKQDD
jgi:hypothetical protein